MLQAQDRVVAGISGGADSVCLLFVLLEYRKKVPFDLAVVHVNHGIRKDAAEDASYVERLCREQDIPFYLFQKNVQTLAKEWGCSEEEAGRKVRYEAFQGIAEEWNANKIAVAHNSNDRSETMLFHLFRGSNIRGLASIRPVRDNIIRPILCLERAEIEEYLEDRGISYCTDITNATDDYTRNRIRHHILPYAEQEIVSGSISHMAQTAEMLEEVDEYLDLQTEEARSEAVTEEVGVKRIDVTTFLKLHKVIQKRLLHCLLCDLTVHGRDITHVHISDLLSLFSDSGNRDITLPYELEGRRRYGEVIIECRKRKEGKQAGESIYGIAPDMAGKLPVSASAYLELQILDAANLSQEIPTNQYTKWFDCDKIRKSLDLRTRQQRDYLTIADSGGNLSHKSLKDFLIDRKIPREERDNILLLAEDNHILWVVGHRISEFYKVDRNTKRILQVQLIGIGCDDSETEEKNG